MVSSFVAVSSSVPSSSPVVDPAGGGQVSGGPDSWVLLLERAGGSEPSFLGSIPSSRNGEGCRDMRLLGSISSSREQWGLVVGARQEAGSQHSWINFPALLLTCRVTFNESLSFPILSLPAWEMGARCGGGRGPRKNWNQAQGSREGAVGQDGTILGLTVPSTTHQGKVNGMYVLSWRLGARTLGFSQLREACWERKLVAGAGVREHWEPGRGLCAAAGCHWGCSPMGPRLCMAHSTEVIPLPAHSWVLSPILVTTQRCFPLP